MMGDCSCLHIVRLQLFVSHRTFLELRNEKSIMENKLLSSLRLNE